jgi:phosphate:Na+ symporter
MAAEVPRQIANANTIFNVANTLLFLPFTAAFARLVSGLLPDRPEAELEIILPRFLDEALVATPALALERVRLEFGHMGERVEEMWRELGAAFEGRDRTRFNTVAQMDDQVDILHGKIVQYLGEIRQRELNDLESGDFLDLLSASNYLESVGDVVETNLVELGYRMLDQNLHASDAMRSAFRTLGLAVVRALNAAIRSVAKDDQRAAQEVLTLKAEVNRGIDAVLQHQVSKLGAEDPNRLAIFRVEMGIVDSLKRTYTLAKRIAKLQLPKELLSAQAG